jgi:hypothetical protein
MNVNIDGVSFVPVCASANCIGIAITTCNRADVLKMALKQHNMHLPAGALLMVIDDGSLTRAEVPDTIKLHRHETSLGIIASKNASLSSLMEAGCEHLFMG